MTTTKVMINSVLEKKLDELESLREAITFNDDDPNVYRDIELRVIFAKTLLAAEISSRPMDMEGESVSEERLKLAWMAKRLNELEEDFKTNQLSGHDSGSVIEPETESMETNDGAVDGESETGSVYSWVESCLNEVTKTEEEEEKEEDAEQWPLVQDASSEKKEATFPADASSEENKKATFPAEVAEEKEVVVREVKEKRRLGFRVLVCFGLIGLVGGMKILLGYIGDYMKEDGFFLTPT